MRITVLLGAGASMGAGMPGVADITARLLDPTRTIKQGSTFRFHDEPVDPHRFAPFLEPVARYTELLAALRKLADRFYGEGSWTDYEDVANIAQQIVDARSNFDNPALLPLLEQLAAVNGGEPELRSLTRDSLDYIHELVAWMLRDRGWPLDYLAPLCDAFADESVAQLDVFTLSHDLILDRVLAERRIAFSDGFEDRWGTLLLWTDTYGVPSRRFFKLHGSLDWYRYNLDLDGWRGQVTARPVSRSNPEHPVGPNGDDIGSPCEGRAEFLAGTFTKILAYPSGIYADQHARFHESLRAADAVLVVGYGFRDRAINSRLIAWMTRPRTRPRMVVVDPAAAEMEQRAREAIALKWKGWCSSGAVVAVANRLGEETPWPELRAALTAAPGGPGRGQGTRRTSA
jgi:hypothetical protein